jgi:hypothetical protein
MVRSEARGERLGRARRSQRRGHEATLQKARMWRVTEARRKLERAWPHPVA